MLSQGGMFHQLLKDTQDQHRNEGHLSRSRPRRARRWRRLRHSDW